jgi:hypothetical protein
MIARLLAHEFGMKDTNLGQNPPRIDIERDKKEHVTIGLYIINS